MGLVAVAGWGWTARGADLWEGALKEFDKKDQQKMPAPGGIVFTGSSSIRLWDLAKSFPDQSPVNRGFGGSQASDALAHVDRLVIRYQPRLVVFYSGDNDLALGKSPAKVHADYVALVDRIHAALPSCRVLVLSIKPSPARKGLADRQQATNTLLKEWADTRELVDFVDVGTVLLDANRQARAELFEEDGLHLNEKGYVLWSEIVAPHLK